jgi:hypothetical protein
MYFRQYPYLRKVVDKYTYQLELTINEKGEILRFEQRSTEIIDNSSYWFWTDEVNPHKRIIFRPSYAIGYKSCDYDIDLTNSNLILRNIDHNLEMKFIKK